jgi:hypothetical protein
MTQPPPPSAFHTAPLLSAAAATFSPLPHDQETSNTALPATLASIAALAGEKFALSDYAGAAALYRRQLALQERLEGLDATWATMYNLSGALVRQRENAEAEGLLRKLLPLLRGREDREGREGVFMQQEVGTLVLLMEALGGREGEVEGLYREAVGMVEGLDGERREGELAAFREVWEKFGREEVEE